jgi:tRNA(fMet)-specific endonuclease VapC
MKYLLDTNVCIHMLRKKGNVLVKQRLRNRNPSDIRLCSIVFGELNYGVERSNDPAKNRVLLAQFVGPYISLDFDTQAATEFAIIRYQLEIVVQPIGPYDLQIASIARVHNLTLVTHNTSEFGRVPGLTLEDWEVP